MTLTVQPVRSERELRELVDFPWRIYRGDPCWVAPIRAERRKLLDVQRGSFWRTAFHELFIARRDGQPVGTIAAIVDPGRIQAVGQPVGAFGFFECLPDQETAQALFSAAGEWLSEQGMQVMRGPYNPSGENECGILIEGFDTRPAILEAHTPPYYPGLVEACGLVKYRDLLARLWRRPADGRFETELPGKLARVAALAARRSDLHIRPIDKQRWDAEIEMAWRIHTEALASLPEYVPISLVEFSEMTGSFRAIMDPRLVLIAELNGQPVAYAVALPDVNQILQKFNGRLGLLEMLRLKRDLPRCTRASFKVATVLPDYQGRGIESALSAAIGRAVWDAGYQELDLSLTGEENEKSNRFQENLGFKVYRRYRLYQQELR